MDKKEFLKIIQQPTQLNNEQIFELEELIQRYPYFQTARVLYLKALKQQNSFRYNQSLKTTAIYTTDRSVLFDFITSEIFHNPIAEQEENEIIKEIELRDEIIIENINSQEDTTEVKDELLEFDLPKINPETEESTDSKTTLENTIAEENAAEFENFEKEIDAHLASILQDNKDIQEEKIIPDEIEETISLPIEDNLLDTNSNIEDEENENLITSDNSEDYIDKEEVDNNEADAEIDAEIDSIDKAFIYPDNFTETPYEENEHFQKLKREKPQFDKTDAPVDLNTSDEIYKSILKNPLVFDDETTVENITDSQNKKGSFIFEIATDEIIESIDTAIEPSSEETNISTFSNDTILFEPVKDEIDIPEETTITETPVIDLDVEKPVHFNKNESHSFSEWMQLSSFKPIDRNVTPPLKNEKEEKMALIDEFMTKKPKIKPSKEASFSVDFEQVEESDGTTVMTETLALVYIEQKKYDNAIKAYEILSLKFPEKSSFFADQIKMLKDLKQTGSSD
jgi:hypothetical protein